MEKYLEVSAEVLMACSRDDRRSIRFLYEYCFKKLMPICFRYHHNEEDARAALNAGFMKILKGINSIDESVNFNAWSKRIMINSLIDEYRKNKKYIQNIQIHENEQLLDQWNETGSNDGERYLGYEGLLKLVNELPITSSKVFNLYVIDGYSHKEIGSLLGISEGTSKWHLSTARRLLREKLNEQDSFLNNRMVI